MKSKVSYHGGMHLPTDSFQTSLYEFQYPPTNTQYTILGLAISPLETTNVLHFKSVCFWYNENVLFL
jgi:hypothetical protein